jgi:hypothetical protein
VLEVAVGLDIFTHFHIKGNSNIRSSLLLLPINNNREWQQQRQQRQQQQEIDNNNNNNIDSRPSLRPFGMPIQFCSNIRRLQLSCLILSRDDAQILRQGLEDVNSSYSTSGYKLKKQKPSTNNRVTKLSISNTRLLEGALDELIRALRYNTSLEDLALVNCGLTDSDIERIVHALSRHANLTTLRLHGNQCSQRGSHAIVSWLSQNDCTLESLQISHQNCNNHGVLSPQHQNHHPRNQQQQRDHTNNINDIASTSDPDQNNGSQLRIKYLTEYWKCAEENCFNKNDTNNQPISKNKSLKYLKLCGNDICDDDMEHVGRLLQHLISLKELDLDSNQITDAGLEVFAKNEIPSHLRVLRLSGNQLTQRASYSLLNILKLHAQLDCVTCYDFWKNTIHENEIRQFLSINGAGRVLLRHAYENGDSTISDIQNFKRIPKMHSPPHVPIGIWPLVFARINRGNPMTHLNFGCKDNKKAANGIFYLLQYGPVLLEYTRSSQQLLKHQSAKHESPKKRERETIQPTSFPYHWLSVHRNKSCKRSKISLS